MGRSREVIEGTRENYEATQRTFGIGQVVHEVGVLDNWKARELGKKMES